MKLVEWVMAISLVVIGLSCLTMSANWFESPNSVRPYVNTLFQICMWAGIPVIAASLIYFVFIRKKNDQN
jgi:hypothetical protein